MAAAASTIKRVSLELGGNAPFIVFEDADLPAAAAACMSSALRNAGQTCICTNRVFVHERVHDEFAQHLVDNVRKLKVRDVEFYSEVSAFASLFCSAAGGSTCAGSRCAPCVPTAAG